MKNICGLNFHRRRIRDIYEELKPGNNWEYTGGYLMNREQVGIPLRRALQQEMFSIPEPGVLVVDFTDVKEMTGSVTEEVGPMLFGDFQNHRNVSPDKYLIYDNLSEEVHKGLAAWFGRYNHCVSAFLQEDRDGIKPLIGELPPDNLLEVLEYCYAHGLVSSSDMEQRFSAASKKLNDLHSQYSWLLRRHNRVRGDTPRSWRYQFIPITPMDRVGAVSLAQV